MLPLATGFRMYQFISFSWFYSCVFVLQCLAQVSFESALQKVIFVHLRSTCAFVISKHTIIYLPINSYITSSRHTTPGRIRLDNPGSWLLHRLGRIGVGWSEIVTAEFSSGACTVGGIIKWVAQSQILCVAFLHCRDWRCDYSLRNCQDFFIRTLFSSFPKRPVGSQSGSFIPG